MSDMILEIRHLSKTFGTHAVLKDVDFTVSRGDVTSIIGASGSGKSTLLRCINLLETLTTGEILSTERTSPVEKSIRVPIAPGWVWYSRILTSSIICLCLITASSVS